MFLASTYDILIGISNNIPKLILSDEYTKYTYNTEYY